jgi:cupin superfamily acireductone dioxygenase involved in methionine salvage
MSYENLKELTIKQYNRETTMEKHNAKLPVWMLTPNEEKEARKRWKEYAYKECDEVVKSMCDHGANASATCYKLIQEHVH